MTNSSECKKPSPVLMKLDLPIFLHLDGLATRTDLADLDEKRVTAKVRESLKNIFNGKQLTVACRAIQKKGIWIGHGTLNGKIFTWLVLNRDSDNN